MGMLSTAYTQSKPVARRDRAHLRVRAQPGRGEQGDCVQFSIVDRAILDHLSLPGPKTRRSTIFTRPRT